ncbi:uncharacterized protein LOC144328922 [Podarcis muralis]
MRRLELTVLENRNNSNNTDGQKQMKIDLKRFPEFRDKDSPEAFLVSFEIACHDFQVREEDKMMILRARISGPLAEIYAQMTEEQSQNFEVYEQLIYTRFGITSEQLREKFRSVTKVREETYAQLGAKIKTYLTRWLEQENADTVPKIREVIALEQFYDTINGQLKYLIKERNPKTIEEAAGLADKINEIRVHGFDGPKFGLDLIGPLPRASR